jgi:aliphatic nitrilase
MILDPIISVIGAPLSESQGIVYAEIDTSRSVEPKQFRTW